MSDVLVRWILTLWITPIRQFLWSLQQQCRVEERRLRPAIEGILRADYPAERRQVLVISDASTDGTDDIADWHRVRRAGHRRHIDLDVLMASAAIPFIFPASSIDGSHYGDGAMRQLAPLSPAVHLGANRVLVIGTRGNAAATPPPATRRTP